MLCMLLAGNKNFGLQEQIKGVLYLYMSCIRAFIDFLILIYFVRSIIIMAFFILVG